MKVLLMACDRDFNMKAGEAKNAEVLEKDLELGVLFQAMASGDELIHQAVRKAVLSGTVSKEEILYRQAVLRDCLGNIDTARQMYSLAQETIESAKRSLFGFSRRSPGSMLYFSREALSILLQRIRELRTIAEEHAGDFRSEGFLSLFGSLRNNISDKFLEEAREHIRLLDLPCGLLMSAGLGGGSKGKDYVLHRPPKAKGWLGRLMSPGKGKYRFRVHERDQSGLRALSELEDAGIRQVALIMARTEENLRGFFEQLRVELAFYMGCLNLREMLSEIECPLCFPDPRDPDSGVNNFKGLYDPCLALSSGNNIVGNELDLDGRGIVFITGANQGGKSTFLRSIGIAQLMMQCGMFVPAVSFSALFRDGIFTHFRRKEDTTMKSGKLDEELGRMSEMIELMSPGSMILFNESFASTNEKEGSEIGRNIVRGIAEKGVRIFFVTHLYDLAGGFEGEGYENIAFLKAERLPGGERTFRIIEGEPEPTSYGRDLYEKLFDR